MTVNLNKIRGLMAEHGDTQKDLAEKLQISVVTLRGYLKGYSVMRVDTIAKIAEIYGVPALDLLVA